MVRGILISVFIISSINLQAQTRIFPSSRAQIETPIAINPTNTNNLIGAAITEVNSSLFKIGYYYSLNGGNTWQGSEEFSGSTSAGDPVIAFDPDGTVYIIYQVRSEKKIYMRKSTDGGANWIPSLGSPATQIISVSGLDDLDKPWLAVSPIRNASGNFNIYISLTLHPEPGNTTSLLFKSTNGGASFQQIKEEFSASNHYLGTYVQVGPDGEVFFAWAKALTTKNKVISIMAERSTNEGTSFQNLVEIPVIQIGNFQDPNYYIKNSNIRADCFPRIAIDYSPYSRGTAYLVWTARTSEGGDADIKMIKGSLSGGQFNWNTNVINLDSGTGDQWMPAVDINPDGIINVLYYSSGIEVNDPVYTKLRYSTNGGSNFSEINVGSVNGFIIPSEPIFLGDYQGVSSSFGKAFAFWCEYKTDPTYNSRQVYFRSLNLSVIPAPSGYVKTTVDQKDESNQSFEKFGRWNQGSFTNYTAPFQFLFQTSTNEIIKAKQEFKTGTYQKYYNWNIDNIVLNHRNFSILTGLTSIISQFKNSQSGVTLQNNFLDSPGINPANDVIDFYDPWFIDYSDQNYGLRNRGTGAIPHSRLAPFYPNYSTLYENSQSYKGILLNQNLSFDPLFPIYSVRSQQQDIYLSQTGKTHKFYFQNWTYDNNKIDLQNPSSNQTALVFKTNDASITANLKGTQLSNDLNAYINNSQRKFIRTPDGILHQVYSSLGRVWYEQSTDGGATWIIANQGKPIDNGQGKLPSIDYIMIQNPVTYQVIIVYQEQYSTGFRIKAKSFQKNSGGEYYNYFYEVVIATYLSESYSNNANPVIAVDIAGDITYAWEQKSGTAGLYCRTGHTNIYDLSLYGSSNVRLTNTTSASKNPTIAVVKAGLTGVKHIAWEENYQIKYSTLNGTTIGTIETPSNSIYNNFKPSITVRYAAAPGTPYPAIVWLIEEPENYQKRVQLRIKFSSGSWSQYWSWYYPSGGNVYSTNINSNSEGKFVISWGGDSNDQYMTSLTSSVVYNLSTQGDVQVSNAESVMGDMKIMSFDKISAVHDFTHTAVTQGLYKGTGNEIVSKGFILSNNNDFYVFDFGAIEADGNRMFFGDSFEEADPSIKNNKIETESFYLSENSILNFKADYFSSNSQLEASPAKFKLQLIDVNSGEPLILLKEEGNVNTSYNNQGFAVNLNGLGDKEVKLQLIFDAESFSSEIYTKTVRDSSQINKGHYQQISYDGEETVKDYVLSQNYPNPFNPNTIIKYQLPQDGFVTLKIYDTLGKEVKTLVNEYKTTGRYEVNFDASSLASGVYVYTIKANDFVSSKKMILAK